MNQTQLYQPKNTPEPLVLGNVLYPCEIVKQLSLCTPVKLQYMRYDGSSVTLMLGRTEPQTRHPDSVFSRV